MSFQRVPERDASGPSLAADPAPASSLHRSRPDAGPAAGEMTGADRRPRTHARTAPSPDRVRPLPEHPGIADSLGRYWRTNIRIMLALLIVWAAAGLGCGVLLAEVLNQYRLGGFPLGFWFAQQGSILAFVALILVYALLLNRLDRRHHREITDIRENDGTS
jgi:putative solute:sodium symporter small subunit